MPKAYGWTCKETRDGDIGWISFHGYRAEVIDMDGDGSMWSVTDPEGNEVARGTLYESDDFQKGKIAAWHALGAALPERFLE